jgi:hypothetical protein
MNTESPNVEWDIEEMKNSYKEAAEKDRFLFGDFDYSYVWLEDNVEGR